jgi:glycosyltransferase involved in cell wall biosynthesis
VKILIAHFRPDIVSGAELAIADMVVKRSDGFEYVMLTPGEGKLADYYRSRGFPVWARKVQSRRRKYPGLHTLQSLWFAQRLKRAAVDAVLCNTFPAAGRVGTACRLARKPYAIYVREYIRDVPLHRRVLQKADLTFAVSRDVASYLQPMAPPDCICTAYDHLDIDPILQRVARHRTSGTRLMPFKQEHPVVGTIGRITAYKQQDLFLRAVPLILADVPTARFVIVGSAVAREQDYENSLARLVADLGVENQVVFLGQHADAIEIMSELAVCCLTSDREPFPRTVLEAQAVGCPVVASDTGGCPEMVQDGATGLLFPAAARNAAQNLAEQVSRVLRHPGFAQGLAAKAQGRVRATFGSRAPVLEVEARLRSLARLS